MNIKLKAAASLALAAILGSSGAYALTANQAFTQGDLKFLVSSVANKEVNVYAANTSTIAGDIVIPGTITVDDNGESVTLTVIGVGASGFKGATNLTSLTFPESLTRFNTGAFYGCTSLVMNKLPEQTTFLDTSVFYGCTSITEFELPGYLKTVPQMLFRGCTGLRKVTLPESVTTINTYAFYGCSNLTDINLPSGLKTINSSAFSNTGLKTLTIPESCTEILASAFSSCASLTELNLHEGITSIGNTAFNGCKSLTSLTLPSNVETVGYRAFSECTGLTEITIPGGITSFGPSTFSGCTKLTKVTFDGEMPDLNATYSSTTGMNFKDVLTIKEIVINGTTLNEANENNFMSAVYAGATLYVTGDTYKTALATAPWNKFANIVNMDPEIGDTTGVEEIAAETAEGKAEIYTITGFRLNAITAPGLYIVNGKKVIVK